eukprot:jgi/Mesvir1/25159/Mv18839-RA.1
MRKLYEVFKNASYRQIFYVLFAPYKDQLGREEQKMRDELHAVLGDGKDDLFDDVYYEKYTKDVRAYERQKREYDAAKRSYNLRLELGERAGRQPKEPFPPPLPGDIIEAFYRLMNLETKTSGSEIHKAAMAAHVWRLVHVSKGRKDDFYNDMSLPLPITLNDRHEAEWRYGDNNRIDPDFNGDALPVAFITQANTSLGLKMRLEPSAIPKPASVIPFADADAEPVDPDDEGARQDMEQKEQKSRCVGRFVDGKYPDPDATDPNRGNRPFESHDPVQANRRQYACPPVAAGASPYSTRLVQKPGSAARCKPPLGADFTRAFDATRAAGGEEIVQVRVDPDADDWLPAVVVKAPLPNRDDRVRADWKKGVTNDPWFVVDVLPPAGGVGPRQRMRVMRNRVRLSPNAQTAATRERDDLRDRAMTVTANERAKRVGEKAQQRGLELQQRVQLSAPDQVANGRTSRRGWGLTGVSLRGYCKLCWTQFGATLGAMQ